MRITSRSSYFGRTIFAVVACALMIVVAFQPMATAEQGAPPINGENENDWIIENGDQVVRTAETIILNGNLTVHANATLTLDNVTMKLNCTENGDYKIDVLEGGTLNIINQSTITAMNPSYHYDYYYRVGSKGVIQNSTIRDVGYSTGGSKGLRIEENNITVERSQITENYIGILAYGSDPTIRFNNISSNEYGIYYQDSVPSADASTNKLWNNQTEGKITIQSVDGGIDASLKLAIPNGARVLNASINITAENATGIGYLNESAFNLSAANSYSNLSTSSGDLRLERVDENITETTASDFNGGTKTNLTTISDSLLISELAWTKKGDLGEVFDLGADGKFDDYSLGRPSVIADGATLHMWYSGKDGSAGAWRIGYAKGTDPLMWTRQNSGNAVLNLGASGKFDDVFVHGPTVLKDSSTYKMWYVGNDGANERIGYATSSDGTSWTKQNSGNAVLNLGSSGAWDDYHVSYPCVIQESSSSYKMWYSGNDGSTWKIGYATSSDGISWTKYASNPVLTAGAAGKFDDGYVAVPTVLKSGSTYHMWYQGYDGTANVRIGYATSSTGTSWTRQNSGNAVLDLGASGEFDDYHVAHPFVWQIGSEQKMVYYGYDGSQSRIGYAVANGGISWSKFSSNGGVVFETGQSGKFDEKDARNPSIILDGETYKMWYTGKKSATSEKGIGYATSVDGYGWERQNSGNAVLAKGSSGAWDDEQVYEASVIKDGSTYKIWYTGYGGTGTYNAIGYATSSDGITWTKYDSDGGPVMEKGSTGAWDSGGVRSPLVIKDDGTYKMWYTGNNTKIGYATSSDGITWTKSGSNPVLTGSGVSGKPDEDGVSLPAVIRDGDLYIMLFTGYNYTSITVWKYKILMAYSTDGISWTRMNEGNAVIDLGASGDFDDYHVITSTILGTSTGYKTWYSGCDASDASASYYYHYRIGYAYSNALTKQTASYVSRVYNLTRPTIFEDYTWSGSSPSANGLIIQSRTSWDNVTWSSWSNNYYNNTTGELESPNNRYFQYRVLFNATSSRTPVFNRFIVNYSNQHYPTGFLISNPTGTDYNITKVLPVWQSNETLGHLFINISNNNGTNYYSMTNNQSYTFPSNHELLRYRINLITDNINTTPSLDFLNITYYTEKVYPFNFSVDVGNDGDDEWNMTGNFTTYHVLSGSTLVDELNDLLASWKDGPAHIPIGFSTESPGNLTVKDISITWSLPGTHDNDIIDNTYGLYFENSNNTVDENSIVSNTYGAWFDVDSEAHVTHSLIYQNTQTGVVFLGPSFIENSSIYDNTNGINVTGTTAKVFSSEIEGNNWYSVISRSGGHLVLEDTSYDKHKVIVEDNSDILVKHYLTLEVLNPDGTPVSTPQIYIYDKSWMKVFEDVGNSTGFLVNITLKELLITASGKTYYTPHTLKTDDNNNVTFIMDGPRYLIVYLGDDTDNDNRIDAVESNPNILTFHAYEHRDGEDNDYIINDTFPTAGSGRYQWFIHAAVNSKTVRLTNLNYTVYDTSDNVILPTETRELSYFQWYSSSYFDATTDVVRLEVGSDSPNKDEDVNIDMLMLVRYKYANGTSTSVKVGQVTDPLIPDTDVDHIPDGLETRNGTYWYEAEEYSYDSLSEQRYNDVGASNGLAIFNSSSNGETIYVPTTPKNGLYQYYIKARSARRLEQYPTWNGTNLDTAFSKAICLAWADIDLDGDLDLAVGNYGDKVVIFKNDNGTLTSEPVWMSYDLLNTIAIDWGDVDGDGYPDLAIGVYNEQLRIYKNYGGIIESDDSPYWVSSSTFFVRSIAFGDANGDDRLDLAMGGENSLVRVFNNTGITLEPSASYSSQYSYDTYDVEWGDMDNDGAIDLAVGNGVENTSVFKNVGIGLEKRPSWKSATNRATRSVAWGDVDNDGDLDLAIGNIGYNEIFFNTGTSLETDNPEWTSSDDYDTYAVDFADIDDNGHLDLIVGIEAVSPTDRDHIYFNPGLNHITQPEFFSLIPPNTKGLGPADINNDGHIDLAVANYGSGNKISVYYNSFGNMAASEIHANITGFVSRTVNSTFSLKPYYQWYSTPSFNITGTVELHVFDQNAIKGCVVIDKVMLVNLTELYINRTTTGGYLFNMSFVGSGHNETYSIKVPQKAWVTAATFAVLGSSQQLDLPNSDRTHEMESDVYENLIVWSQGNATPKSIYLYNTSNESGFRITNDGERPRIFGDYVVFMRDVGANGYDVYRYKLSTGILTAIGSGSGDQKNPDIWGNIVVWEHYANNERDLRIYYLNNGTLRTIDPDGNAYDPSIYENLIVWSDDRHGQREIYLYDLSYSAEILNKRERRVSFNTSGDDKGPVIYGDRMVWFSGSNDINLYAININQTRRIGTDADNSRGIGFYGDKILYVDTTNDLCIYDISSETKQRIDNGDVKYPAIFKDVIAWSHKTDGVYEINRLSQNITLDVGDDGTIDWRHTEYFSEREVTTDFSDAINAYLDDNQDEAQNGFISVPLDFYSALSGFINVTDIDVKLGWISEPLNPDSDADGIGDGTEVYGFHGYDIVETEDAFDVKEWANPYKDLTSTYKIETPVFMYQTGVSLTATNNLNISVNSQTAGQGSIDSWIKVRTHVEETGLYKVVIRPYFTTTVFDTIIVKQYVGETPVSIPISSYSYELVYYQYNTELEEYLGKVVANATYITIIRDGGSEVEPDDTTIVETPVIDKCEIGTYANGTPNDRAAILAFWKYDAQYNFSGGTDYIIQIGLDLSLIPDELRPDMKEELGDDSEVPENLTFDAVEFVRLLDFDRIRIEKTGTNPILYDTDGDGIGDGKEDDENQFSLSADPDKDGLTDYEEIVVYGTDPQYRDTDFDGIRDAVELGRTESSLKNHKTSQGSWFERLARYDDPFKFAEFANYDADNGETVTDPKEADTDNDGLPDGWTDGWRYKVPELVNAWRYDQNYWQETKEFDNIVQIFEGEDLNLDGSNEGEIGDWGFDVVTLEPNGGMTGESDPTSPDTDGDGMPDGYEVYFTTLEPRLTADGNYFLNPTNNTDANEDNDNNFLVNASHKSENGGFLSSINSIVPARAQMLDITSIPEVTNISKIAVNLTANSTSKVRLEIWAGKQNMQGKWEPKYVLSVTDEYWVNGTWFIFDIKDYQFDPPSIQGQRYYIVVRYMGEEFNWTGNLEGQKPAANDYTCYYFNGAIWTRAGMIPTLQLNFRVYGKSSGGDGLTNLEEYIVSTNPRDNNTDRIKGVTYQYDDGITDGSEIGPEGSQVLLRTSVLNGTLEFSAYEIANISLSWIFYYGNGTNGGNYSYDRTIEDPSDRYSLLSEDNLLVAQLYNDGAYILFNRTSDEVYIANSDISSMSETNHIGKVIVYDTNPAPTTEHSRNINLNYRDREVYRCDPTRWDSDGDDRVDGNIDVLKPEAPDWFEDFDGDGLINARDRDSDDDGVLDADEIWSWGGVDGTEWNSEGNVNALDPDSDNDNINDYIEMYVYGLTDEDGDGIISIFDPDSDGDGVPDGNIDGWVYDPVTMTGEIVDPDEELTPNEYEDLNCNGFTEEDESDPLDFDSDDDGVYDGYTIPEEALSSHQELNETQDYYIVIGTPSYRAGELNYSMNPEMRITSDFDGDGLKDGKEIYGWTLAIQDNFTMPENGIIKEYGPIQGPTEIIHVTSDPTTEYSDEDSLNDYQEFMKSNPTDSDSDDDGWDDYAEVNTYHTSPIDADTDDDMIKDSVDTVAPLNWDYDDDFLVDGLELRHQSNFTNGDKDSDNDGLNDYMEYQLLLRANGDWEGDNVFRTPDSDNDGVNDNVDPGSGFPTGTNMIDYDGDGLPNGLDSDSDGDGLLDGEDPSPLTMDTDQDGINDDVENDTGYLKWNDVDTDDDGVKDGFELDEDTDGDSKYNGEDKDSDNDGIPDGYIDGWCYNSNYGSFNEETLDAWGAYCPKDPEKHPWEGEDRDGDGIQDVDGSVPETNRFADDSDRDGILDGIELYAKDYYSLPLWVNDDNTDPLDSDTDNDGLNDSVEVNYWKTNPTRIDSDVDGLNDYDEIDDTIGTEFFSSPATIDTDNDGLLDGYSIKFGTVVYEGELRKEDNPYDDLNPSDNDTDDDGALDGAEVYGWDVYIIKNKGDLEEIISILDDQSIEDEDRIDHILRYVKTYEVHSDPLEPDSDGDGLLDGMEFNLSLDPNNKDTDGDSLMDDFEANLSNSEKHDPAIYDINPPDIKIIKEGWEDSFSWVYVIKFEAKDLTALSYAEIRMDGFLHVRHQFVGAKEDTVTVRLDTYDRKGEFGSGGYWDTKGHYFDITVFDDQFNSEHVRLETGDPFDYIGQYILQSWILKGASPGAKGIIGGLVCSFVEQLESPIALLQDIPGAIRGVMDISQQLKGDLTLFNLMRDGVWNQMKKYYKMAYPSNDKVDPDFEHGFYGGYIAGTVLIMVATGYGMQKVGSKIAQLRIKSPGAAVKAATGKGLKGSLEKTGGITGLIKHTIEEIVPVSYRNSGIKKFLLSAALYTGLAATTMAFNKYPEILGKYSWIPFCTLLAIMNVKDYSDFEMSFQEKIPDAKAFVGSQARRKAEDIAGRGLDPVDNVLKRIDKNYRHLAILEPVKNGNKVIAWRVKNAVIDGYTYAEVIFYKKGKYLNPDGTEMRFSSAAELMHYDFLQESPEMSIYLNGLVDNSGHGIDHIWKDKAGYWHFVEDKSVIEGKFKTKMGELTDIVNGKPVRQTDHHWLEKHLTKLIDEEPDPIRKANYQEALDELNEFDYQTNKYSGKWMVDYTFVRPSTNQGAFVARSVLDDIINNIQPDSAHRRYSIMIQC